MGRVGVLLVLAVVLAAIAATVALAAQSPEALRASIFMAARKEHSVHYVDVGAAQGLSQRTVGDVASTRGIQQITFTLHGKTGKFTVVAVGGLAYIRGNAVALHGFLGYTAAQTSAYHDRWISVPPSSSKYKAYAASVTLPSFLDDIYPRRTLSLVTTKVGAQDVTGVRGTNVVLGTKLALAVFPGSQGPLPQIAAAVDTKHGFIDAIKISRWNEPVNVTAPASAVPISTVESG